MTSDLPADGLQPLRDRAARAFARIYGGAPAFWTVAPGRVNLIGEHTDYNEGYVLPAAIDRHVLIGARPRNDRTVRLYAVDFGARSAFGLDDIRLVERERWSNYERGVAWVLQEAGYALRGMDLVLSSDVPIGSGLSSSAAIEVATAYAFRVASELDLDGVPLALLCQRAENDFVSMRCGIMDQYVISLGQRDCALLIDCRSLASRPVPLPAGVSLIICDTKKRRGLLDSEYNARRQGCEAAARTLGVPALRDVTPEAFQARGGELDELTRRRCRHVVTENQRALDAVEALEAGDLTRVGGLMRASHLSLRDDYQVSCPELDAMVEAAWRQEGVIGARMTGAGFGGCTVNLVDSEAAGAFRQRVAQEYTRATGITPDIYLCRAEEGVHLLE